jgi:hypothetical protein
MTNPTAASPAPLESAWAAQRVWSQTANQLKTRINLFRTIALVLGMATAILAVAADQVPAATTSVGRWLAGAAAFTAGLATLIQGRMSTEQVKTWTRARSAAEGLKTEIYAYLAGGTAYTGDTPDQHLAERTRAILTDVDDLKRHALGITPDAKQPLPVHDADSYVEHRVTGQIEGYYQPKATSYETLLRRFRVAGTLLGILAVALAALATATGVDGITAWVPVVTTVATSLAAYVAAARYDHLVIAFLCTAAQLARLRDSRSELTDAQFVDACESTISIENQAWMARWTQSPTPPP